MAEKKVPHIVDAAFAKRLTEACDSSPIVPDYNKGRLVWIQRQLQEIPGVKVSIESIRKWLSGEARPRPKMLSNLARVMKVDEVWLALGVTPGLTPDQKVTRSIYADGSVNLVAGLVQMDGGHIAFVEPDDPQSAYADFHAIIHGKAHLIKVNVGTMTNGKQVNFSLPNEHDRVTTIGVVKGAPGEYRLYRIPSELVQKYGTPRGGYIELVADRSDARLSVKKDLLPTIPNFETVQL